MLREIRDLGFEYAELSHGTRISLLPGIIEAEYKKHGLTLASPYYVLDTDASADVDIYWEVAAGAGLTGVVLLLSAALVPIAARRAKARGR